MMIHHLLDQRSARVGGLAGQHVVQRAPQRVDVRTNVDVARIAGLLRSNVVEGAQRRTGNRQLLLLAALLLSGQSQIDQLGPP